MDPSTSYRSIRITSSTSIQTTVTTSLLHLSDPSSPALILHTLPIPSSSNNTAANSIAIVPKNTHAALCKLISIIEIIKREFENHQKESWRLQDEKEKRKLAKRRSISKGKKRARDEQEQDDDDVEMLNKEEGGETRDTGSLKVVVDSDTNEANVVGGAKGTSTKSKNATSTTTTAISDKKSTTTTSSSLKEKKKQRKKDRPLLRIYQYNLLDAYEKLPGVVSSALDIVGEGEEDSSDNDSSSSESDNDDDEEEVEDRENKKIEQDLIKSKLKAAKSLDDAIKNHVIRARRRPRKKHTPYMKIILSTRKLPEYENYLNSISKVKSKDNNNHHNNIDNSDNDGDKGNIINETRPKDFTLQLPMKRKSRSRSSSAARKRKTTKTTTTTTTTTTAAVNEGDENDGGESNAGKDDFIKSAVIDTGTSKKPPEELTKKEGEMEEKVPSIPQTPEGEEMKEKQNQIYSNSIDSTKDKQSNQTRQSKKRKANQVDSQEESSEATQFSSSQIIPSK